MDTVEDRKIIRNFETDFGNFFNPDDPEHVQFIRSIFEGYSEFMATVNTLRETNIFTLPFVTEIQRILLFTAAKCFVKEHEPKTKHETKTKHVCDEGCKWTNCGKGEDVDWMNKKRYR